MSNAVKKGVLLMNLGSPDSTDVPDVKKYLDQFLMDERVIDKSWLFHPQSLPQPGIFRN